MACSPVKYRPFRLGHRPRGISRRRRLRGHMRNRWGTRHPGTASHSPQPSTRRHSITPDYEPPSNGLAFAGFILACLGSSSFGSP